MKLKKYVKPPACLALTFGNPWAHPKPQNPTCLQFCWNSFHPRHGQTHQFHQGLSKFTYCAAGHRLMAAFPRGERKVYAGRKWVITPIVPHLQVDSNPILTVYSIKLLGHPNSVHIGIWFKSNWWQVTKSVGGLSIVGPGTYLIIGLVWRSISWNLVCWKLNPFITMDGFRHSKNCRSKQNLECLRPI